MTIATDGAGPPRSISITVLVLARQVEAELSVALAPLGLTVARLGLLGHIANVPGVSFSELARRSRLTVQSVHTAAKALAAAGLVTDRTARAGAASTIEVTPKGAKLLRQAMDAVAGVDDMLFGEHADPLRREVAAGIRAALDS